MSPRPPRPPRAARLFSIGLFSIRLFTASLFTVALVTTPACDKVEEASQARQQEVREQAAIQAYSAEVPRVDALLRSFTQVWREANELPDPKALHEAVDARVLPALRAYVDALAAMPTKSDTLAGIHKPLVAAYEGAYAAFQKFADGLKPDNVEARYQDLLGALDAVMRAEDTYYDALTKYYEANDTKLSTKEAAPAPSAAKPANPAAPASSAAQPAAPSTQQPGDPKP